MILFNRKDLVIMYYFGVDTRYRISDLLSIMAYTGDTEMMELLKPDYI